MQSETQSTLNGYHNFNHEIKCQIKKLLTTAEASAIVRKSHWDDQFTR